MMKPDDVTPRARNFYREEDYFSLNVKSGVVRSAIGTRMVTLPEELILGLTRAVEEETGGAAPVVLYQCGRWWGKQFARRQALEVRHFYNLDAGELPLAFYLQILRRVWAMYGWGKLDISFDLRAGGFLEATVVRAPISEVLGSVGRTTDHLVAGVLASVVSELAGRDLEAVETTCKSRGDQRCVFLIGLKPRVDVIAAWLKQGRSHAAIVEAIGAGELV